MTSSARWTPPSATCPSRCCLRARPSPALIGARAVGDYLLGLEAFDRKFPGFEHDTHGVEVETDERGRPYYALYCLSEE